MVDPVTATAVAAPARPAAALRMAPAALLSAALLGTNVLSYLFTVLAARLLAPAAYGELAALMALVLVGVVPATGVQTAAALRLGRTGAPEPDLRGRLHATAAVTALAVGALGLLAVAPAQALLHLADPAALAWLVAVLVPHTLIGGYEGMLQGSRRYGRLAAVNAGFGATKVAGGIAGLLVGGTPAAALAGMAGGAAVGAILGWSGCGRPFLRRGLAPHARAAGSAAAGLLGFVVLFDLDVLLARHHLPPAEAGRYAVAALFAKVAFWLPQGVGVVLLPSLGDARTRRRALPSALGLVAAVGAALALGVALLAGRALTLVGGSAYGGPIGSATWLFAVLGTLLALAQLLLFSGIAAADRTVSVAVWTAAVAEAGGVQVLASTGLLTAQLLVVTAATTATVLVGIGLLRLRAQRAAPTATAERAPGAAGSGRPGSGRPRTGSTRRAARRAADE